MNQLQLKPGMNLDPIPEPRRTARSLASAIALTIGGPVDDTPQRLHSSLRHGLLMEGARVFIVGTGCGRPLMQREACDISAAMSVDVVVARCGEAVSKMTFDAKLLGEDRLVEGLRLWKDDPALGYWLVPALGAGPCLRLEPTGLGLANDPPFENEIERWRGLKYANEFLSTVVKGFL